MAKGGAIMSEETISFATKRNSLDVAVELTKLYYQSPPMDIPEQVQKNIYKILFS